MSAPDQTHKWCVQIAETEFRQQAEDARSVEQDCSIIDMGMVAYNECFG